MSKNIENKTSGKNFKYIKTSKNDWENFEELQRIKQISKYKQSKSEDSAQNCHIKPTHYNPITENYFS